MYQRPYSQRPYSHPGTTVEGPIARGSSHVTITATIAGSGHKIISNASHVTLEISVHSPTVPVKVVSGHSKVDMLISTAGVGEKRIRGPPSHVDLEVTTVGVGSKVIPIPTLTATQIDDKIRLEWEVGE